VILLEPNQLPNNNTGTFGSSPGEGMQATLLILCDYGLHQ
jgi:hypothetical protein